MQILWRFRLKLNIHCTTCVSSFRYHFFPSMWIIFSLVCSSYLFFFGIQWRFCDHIEFFSRWSPSEYIPKNEAKEAQWSLIRYIFYIPRLKFTYISFRIAEKKHETHKTAYGCMWIYILISITCIKYLFEYENAARMILSISHKNRRAREVFLCVLLRFYSSDWVSEWVGLCMFAIHFINRLISHECCLCVCMWVIYQVKDITHTRYMIIKWPDNLTGTWMMLRSR